MNSTVWLIVDTRGVQRMTKKQPYVDRGEIAFRLHVTVPDAVFRPVVMPDVTIDVPADRVIVPQPSVDVEVLARPPSEDET